MNVWVIQYSKNKRDDVCDSSILRIYEDVEECKADLKELRERGDGEFFYYAEPFVVITKIKNMPTLTTKGNDRNE